MPSNIHDKANQLIALAKSSGMTIGTAESCTGGWIGKALTEISGSSSVYMGGFITYSNATKLNVLGIPPEILEFYGAVSEPTAGAMALQARDMLAVDIAVSVTGIAGPTGGSAEKPIGMVCFGIARRGAKPVVHTKLFGDIGRNKVRQQSVLYSLEILYKSLI